MGFKDRMSGGGLDATPGFMLKVPGTPHRTQLASWENDTRVRVFPAPAANGGWEPMRNSAENDDFGNAVTVEPCCRKLGVYETFTYVTRIPGSNTEDPTTKLCKALVTTAKNSPHDLPREWCEWTQGGRGRSAKVNKVQNCIFFQGAMLTINGKDCVNNTTHQPEPRFPSLFMGSVSVLMTFSRLGNMPCEYGGPVPSSIVDTTETGRMQLDQIYAGMFELGDWCSPENGRIMRVYQAPATAESRPHYGIEMQEAFSIAPIADRVRALWTPWDKLLRTHTAEEQIGYLLRAFPPEAVDFGLGRSEYEEMLPPQVRGSWQKLQQQMSGAWSPGLPAAAAAQVNQGPPNRMPGIQSAPPAPPAPPAPAAPAQAAAAPAASPVQQPDTGGWGNGGVAEEAAAAAPAPAGPAVPATPAALAGAPVAPGTNTPAAAMATGAVNAKDLAETLGKLKEGSAGAGGQSA